MKRKVWFIISVQDDVEDWSHDWGGEFYSCKEAAVCRAAELQDYAADAKFIVKMGEISLPRKAGK